MGKLKISFSDFWGGFDEKNNFWTLILEKLKIDYVVVPDNSDILISSCFGSSFLRKNSNKKIYWTGENWFRVNQKLPPIGKSILEIFDHVYSFDYNDSKNHYRMPLYLIDTIESGIEDYNVILRNKSKDALYGEYKFRKFSTFVQSNGNCKFRNEYFTKLNSISKVDSYGSLFNNTGKILNRKEKIEISKEYKFQLAFENSEYDGYVSEKIIDAFKSDIMPIYWGGTLIHKEFNNKSFIDVNQLGVDSSLKLVSDMNSDFDIYWEYYNQPIVSDHQMSISDRIQKFYDNFLQNINY
jgi:hypothetical protein